MRDGREYARPYPGPLFDEARTKDRGKELSATNAEAMLLLARGCALWLAREFGRTDIDAVRAELERRSIKFVPGNWMGSVFAGKEWKAVGYKKAEHVGSHNRMITIWELR